MSPAPSSAEVHMRATLDGFANPKATDAARATLAAASR